MSESTQKKTQETVVWFCNKCGRFGSILIASQATDKEIRKAIEEDHDQKSRCPYSPIVMKRE